MAEDPQREELRPFVRREPPPDPGVIAVRGGPDSVGKLRSHASRTHRAFALDGRPIWGISVSCALESSGRASLEDLLQRRFSSYGLVHVPRVGALVDAGFELLPTFNWPHYTVRLASAEDDELARLLVVLGQARENLYHGRGQAERR